jgi:hypothetical protein
MPSNGSVSMPTWLGVRTSAWHTEQHGNKIGISTTTSTQTRRLAIGCFTLIESFPAQFFLHSRGYPPLRLWIPIR